MRGVPIAELAGRGSLICSDARTDRSAVRQAVQTQGTSLRRQWYVQWTFPLPFALLTFHFVLCNIKCLKPRERDDATRVFACGHVGRRVDFGIFAC